MSQNLKLNRLGRLLLPVLSVFALGSLFIVEPAGCAAMEDKKIDVFQVLVVNEDGTPKGQETGYIFAGIVVDRARSVKRDHTDGEVKIAEKLPAGSNSGKAYDVIFLLRPDAVSKGKILTLTSAPAAKCRPYLKTFLTKTLSSKRISKAYKNAKLALVDEEPAAKSLADGLAKDGWLAGCQAAK
jgi:hypothetical protein